MSDIPTLPPDPPTRRSRFNHAAGRAVTGVVAFFRAVTPDRNWATGIIYGGFILSICLALLIGMLPVLRHIAGAAFIGWLHAWHEWIIWVYITWQLFAIGIRSPVDYWQAIGDHFFSLTPTFIGSVLVVLPIFATFTLPGDEERNILHEWLAWCWTEFAAGLLIQIRIAYRSFETPAGGAGVTISAR